MSVTSGICCFPDMVRVWSGKTPNKAALIDGGRVVTYAQLNDRSNRIANTLIAAGIRPTASGKVQKAALRQQLQG